MDLVRNVLPAHPGFFPNISHLQSLRGGKDRLAVPVIPLQSVYAHFEHLRGVPSPEGGISLFKLQVLDRLIDRLLANRQPVPLRKEISRLRQGDAEAMIVELGSRLARRLASLGALPGGFTPETGMLVDLVA
jgi:hypothetical protein